MKKIKIAILGSTSHIAKGLINNFLQDGGFGLHLYTRSPDKVRSFFDVIGKSRDKDCIIHKGYSGFMESSYDVVINCVGVGTINKLQGDYASYFTVTEEYDNLVIDYLRKRSPKTLYISFSSGAVYGRGSASFVKEATINKIRVNHIAPEDYYGIARLNSEAKHRSFKHLRIVDLRLFSYFSRFIDLSDGYFISDIMNCILKKKVLRTDNVNITRDYVHPKDLFSIIIKCMNAGMINDAFDVTSSKPVKKKEIFVYFSSQYGLKYKIVDSLRHKSATGSKNIYYSNYSNALKIGYRPLFSSMDTIKQESKYILNFNPAKKIGNLWIKKRS